MAIATIDGNQVIIPDFAMDKTVRDLATVMDGNSKKLEELLKKMRSGTATNTDVKNFDKAVNHSTSSLQRKTRQIEATKEAMGAFEKTLVTAGNTAGVMFAGLITGGVALSGIIGGLIMESFMKFGDALNSLTTVGLNQYEAIENNVADLVGMGMTFNQAMDFVMESSLAFQEVGLETNKLAVAFRDATQFGANLGVALDDMFGILQDEINVRARLGNMGNLEEATQLKIIDGMEDMVRTQFKYTRALGESIDSIRLFALNLVRGSAPLQSALLLLSEELRQNTITEVQEFGSVLAATGKATGESLAQAAVEAASFGAIGFSQQAMEFVTVLPRLAGGFTNAINGFRNGVFDGEEAALEFTNILGNLTENEKQRIFSLARMGNQQALEMNKSIMLFEQSVTRIQQFAGEDFRPEALQRAYNTLGAVPRTFLSLFDEIRLKLMASFAGLGDSVFDAITNNLSGITSAVSRTVDVILGLEKGPDGKMKISKTMESFINSVNTFLEGIVAKIDAFNIQLAYMMGDVDDGGLGLSFGDVLSIFYDEKVKPFIGGVLDTISNFFQGIFAQMAMTFARYTGDEKYKDMTDEQFKRAVENEKRRIRGEAPLPDPTFVGPLKPAPGGPAGGPSSAQHHEEADGTTPAFPPKATPTSGDIGYNPQTGILALPDGQTVDVNKVMQNGYGIAESKIYLPQLQGLFDSKGGALETTLADIVKLVSKADKKSANEIKNMMTDSEFNQVRDSFDYNKDNKLDASELADLLKTLIAVQRESNRLAKESA